MRAFRSFVATLVSLALVVQAPLSALAAGADFAPAASDDIARRCDALAASPFDPQYSGPRAALNDASIGEALRLCAQAAQARPVRPRYQYLYGRVLWNAQRHGEAAQQFAAARSAGNAWGALALGGLSERGLGVPRSYEVAANLYSEAASAGLALADYSLGKLYARGAGVPRDANEAARRYDRALRGGVNVAYAGLMWLAFDTTPPSYPQAVGWAQQAADAGQSDGALVLGWCYLTGNGVRHQDPVLGAIWYREAARQGSADAMARLGIMARDGLGVPKDAHAAADWLRQAGEQGHAWAQLELARMLIAGTEVTRDARAAYAWALEAAKANLVPAQVLVAALAHDGDGVPRNRAEAVAWFRKAAERGDTFAMVQLGWHLREGDGTPRNEAEAVRWLREAADRGSVNGAASLGEGYMNGYGGRGPDYRAAAYWLERAASKGNAAAQVNLGVLCLNGWGVPRDLQHARSLFVQATQSPEPKVARQARENLAVMSGRPMPGRNRDDSGAAVVGAALVALAVIAIASGSGESSGGSASGGGTSTTAGGGPFGGSPSSTSTSPSSRPVSTPMNGNITRTLHGEAAMGSTGVNRR